MAKNITDALVPGRECGSCTACCVHLLIDTKEFKKLGGIACEHCEQGKGCGIYETRFPICREFVCGWRLMPELRDSWRPDRIGVIVKPSLDGSSYDFVLFGSRFALFDKAFAVIVANLVAANKQVCLVLPAKPGYLVTRVFLNAGLHAAVKLRDLQAVTDGLLRAYDSGTRSPPEKLALSWIADADPRTGSPARH